MSGLGLLILGILAIICGVALFILEFLSSRDEMDFSDAIQVTVTGLGAVTLYYLCKVVFKTSDLLLNSILPWYVALYFLISFIRSSSDEERKRNTIYGVACISLGIVLLITCFVRG